MNKGILSIGVAILLLTVVFSGCFESEESKEQKKFVGTWKSVVIDENHQFADIDTINFFSDGTYTTNVTETTGTYRIKDGTLSIYIGRHLMWSFEYYFSNNNQELNIADINDKIAIYGKQ